MDTTVKLSRPIEAHGETVAELAFREPTAEIFLLHDESKGEAEFLFRAIAKLAGIPLSSVKAMHPRDFAECSKVVAGFFADASPQDSED